MSSSSGINFCDLTFKARQNSSEGGNFDKTHLPPAASSFLSITLRGAFGLALKRVVCHFRLQDTKTCNECKLRARCPYSLIFDGVPQTDRAMLRLYPYAPQPFVFRDVSRELGENITFTIRLFGPAADLYPYVVVAVEQMLAKGLGRKRTPYMLVEVTDGQSIIYTHERNNIDQPRRQNIELIQPQQSESTLSANTRIRIVSKTPIHIRTENRLNEKPAFLDLMKAGMRRIKLMNYFYGDHTEYWPTELIGKCEHVEACNEDFNMWSIMRFSGRQESKIPLKGVFVNAEYIGCSVDVSAFLQSISQINLGKYGSFGLGQFDIEVIPE